MGIGSLQGAERYLTLKKLPCAVFRGPQGDQPGLWPYDLALPALLQGPYSHGPTLHLKQLIFQSDFKLFFH